MRICNGHSHDLIHELDRRGLKKLIRPELASVHGKLWLEGKASREEFDPYVVATLEIASKAREFGVQALNGSCPLCEIARALQDNEVPEAWLDNCADFMLLIAKANHLVA